MYELLDNPERQLTTHGYAKAAARNVQNPTVHWATVAASIKATPSAHQKAVTPALAAFAFAPLRKVPS